MNRLVATALALLAFAASPAQAALNVTNPCDPERMPPRYALREPTAPLRVDIIAPDAIYAVCKKQRTVYILLGCTFLNRGTADGIARIHIRADLPLDQQACVLLYEEAHLAPNNWFDPVVEATSPNQ